MVDRLSQSARSELMRAVKRAGTTPELRVRKIAHSLGTRYRLHVKRLPGSPDLVFPSRKLCIFVHGCFWHRHADCRLASNPSSNVIFWEEKFTKNVERDSRKEAQLRELGWQVFTIWECETRDSEELREILKKILL